MRRALVALIVGLALGYSLGYGDGHDGRPTVVARALDHFGTSKVKAAQEAQEKRVEEASRP
jgi:hypothetical protein